MPSSLFDLKMLPIFKQFESNILVQDPAQNATNKRANILQSPPRSPWLALLLSHMGISPNPLSVSSLPLLCSVIGLWGLRQENNFPPIIRPECYLLFISGSNSVPMSPQVPAACPFPSWTETPWNNSSRRDLDVGRQNSVLSCSFELVFTYLLSNNGKFNPQTALLAFKINAS